MKNGFIELAALSPPDDEWIIVEASSSMDAYEFANAAGRKPPIMTDKKKACSKTPIRSDKPNHDRKKESS
jgi:hypothetical protein